MNSTLNAVRCYFNSIPTRISGTAREDEELPRISGVRHATWAAAFFAAGIIIGWVGVERLNYPLIIAGWAATIHGSRKLQLNIGHACAHGTVTGNVRRDRLMGELIHFAIVATEFGAYQNSHVETHHNWHVLATEDDPTFLSLAQAGIKPGIPKAELYRRLKCACFSPHFHFTVLSERTKSHMARAGTYRATFLAFWLSVFALVTFFQSWQSFVIAVVVPLVWGYQTAQLLRFCVEHRLPTSPVTPRPTAEMRELTDAIILRPSSAVDLVIRAFVLTCDSVAHDFHHYNPQSGQWANYVSARANAEREARKAGRTTQYHELVGYQNALDKCFDALSRSLYGQSSGGYPETSGQLTHISLTRTHRCEGISAIDMNVNRTPLNTARHDVRVVAKQAPLVLKGETHDFVQTR